MFGKRLVLTAAVLASLTTATLSAPVAEAGVHPHICDDRAPDYNGCTAAQVRVISTGETSNEYTHRYFGSRGNGRIWGSLSDARRHHLIVMYNAAVRRIGKTQGKAAVDSLAFPHFAGFAPHTVSACTVWGVLGMPYRYCNTGTDPNDVHNLGDFIHRTDRVVFACNGTVLGGVVTGVGVTWWAGEGTVAGGVVGGFGGEIGCQTSNLYNTIASWF